MKGCVCCNDGNCYFLVLYSRCFILYCCNDDLAIVLDRNWWYMCKLYFKNFYVALSFRPRLSKSIPYLRPKQLKNHTLWGRTYLNLRSDVCQGKGSSLQCRRYLACERSINVDRVYMPPFGTSDLLSSHPLPWGPF